MNVYPFIDAEKRHGSDGTRGGNVKRSCELLGVSRSAYYTDAATQAAGGSPRARQDAVITEKIIKFHDKSNGTYGSPRVHADLVEAGHQHSRKRVARLMREAGVYGKTRRRPVKTTVPDPNAAQRPDLIERDFTTDATALDKHWCGDITYIQTWEGWAYDDRVPPALDPGIAAHPEVLYRLTSAAAVAVARGAHRVAGPAGPASTGIGHSGAGAADRRAVPLRSGSPTVRSGPVGRGGRHRALDGNGP